MLKEKLSSGFWVKKIKTYPTRARFPNSWCNQPPVNLSQWVDSYLVKSLLFNNNHSSVSSSMLVFSYLVDNNSFQVLKMDFIEHLIVNQLGSSISLDHHQSIEDISIYLPGEPLNSFLWNLYPPLRIIFILLWEYFVFSIWGYLFILIKLYHKDHNDNFLYSRL